MTVRVKPPKVTARGVAISALVAAEDGERANLVVPRLLSASGLDERDRGFVTELAYGTLRMCRACDWLVGQFARGELEPVVRAAARAGAYQLAFMRVPAYAAVSATVSEAPPRARSLLNAVLRRVAALVDAGPLVWPDLGTRLSYPDWVIRRLGEDLGPERAMGALDQMNIAASQTVRADGYTQDPGSQAVAEHMAELMSSRPGAVLDVCAAPGGKATLLAGSSALDCGRRPGACEGEPGCWQRRAARASQPGGGYRGWDRAALSVGLLCRGPSRCALQRAGCAAPAS